MPQELCCVFKNKEMDIDEPEDAPLALNPNWVHFNGEEQYLSDLQLIPPKIKDYKLKPLKKFQHPYFSPRIGSYEIDYTEARADKRSR
jgi:hypothetical protein